MLIAIDGTDSAINKHATSAGCTDFSVQNFKNDYRGPGKAFYWNGPDFDGTGIEDIRNDALKTIRDYLPKDEPLNMIGFSRGGLIVVEIAEGLNAGQFVWPPEDGKRLPAIEVNFLGLYDAVNRAYRQYADRIQPNVKHAYHALRDPLSGSRWYFGNTATHVISVEKTNYIAKTFFTTHGGMGGAYTGGDRISYAPFIFSVLPGVTEYQVYSRLHGARIPGPENSFERMSLEEARTGSIAADNWMRENAQRHGISLALASCHI